MSIKVARYLESAQDSLEYAQQLVEDGEPLANYADSRSFVGNLAEEEFGITLEEAAEHQRRAAELAIDAFKEAYVESTKALIQVAGASGFGDIQDDELGREILEGIDGYEASEVEDRGIIKTSRQAERIVNELENQYGDFVDFEEHIRGALYSDD